MDDDEFGDDLADEDLMVALTQTDQSRVAYDRPQAAPSHDRRIGQPLKNAGANSTFRTQTLVSQPNGNGKSVKAAIAVRVLLSIP
jgi:hypothetical protein